jgi:membrane associated rhomboid family serine protease
VAVFLLEQVASDLMLRLFALWPLGQLFEPWQLLTYGFLHDPRNLAHILFNMLALFMFGSALERHWGARRFVTYYLVCVLAAGLTQLTVEYLSGEGGQTIGASGGVFGLLLAFAMYFPRQRIILLFPPIPMPAWLFVTLYGVLELVLGVTGREANVAHFAHLGGMLGGAIMILLWRTQDRPTRGASPF